MSRRICLFGGSFNPIHHGHLIVARAVAERLQLERIVLLPSHHPPHKSVSDLAEGEHRAEMIRLAIEGEAVFELSDHDLKRPGPCYTIDTVAHFADQFGPAVELMWLIGADSLMELPTWHRAGDLIDACRIVTAVRPGWDASANPRLVAVFGEAKAGKVLAGVLETPMIEIASTEVRSRVQAGRSIRFLVPEAVDAHIARHRLYTTAPC